MAVTSESSIFSEPRISREKFIGVLEEANSFPSALWNGPPRGRERRVASELYDVIVSKAQDPAFWLAICAEEHSYGTNQGSVLWRNDTRSWTNARSVRDPSLEGTYTIVTDPVRQSQYVKYASVTDSLKDGVFRVADPNFVYAQEGRKSVGSVIQRWAPEGRWDQYIDATVERMNRWMGQAGGDLSPTNRLIAMLQERGHDVRDMRGRLPVNSNRAHHYETMPLSHVNYIIHHWTGDSFNRETIRTITGTDYGMDVISPNMSADDEIDMLRWYANYHISKDDHTWGGIAYGTTVFPSGRIYVNWDIGTFTYHAWHEANRQSYATCCPNANGAEPFPGQLTALRDVWDILCSHTPEIPAGQSELIGHFEAKFLDSRNDTNCPGTFQPYVKTFRENGMDSTLFSDVRPVAERRFGSVEFCVRLGFKAYWERLEQKGEAWTALGYPQSDESQVRLDNKERTVQLFDRGALIWEPENNPPWDVHHTTGQQYIEILRQTSEM